MELARALELAAGQRLGVLTTIKRDGRPQLSNISYAVGDDGVVRISVTDGRAKTANLRRDPRAGLYVGRSDGWAYLVIEGTAELSDVAAAPDDPTVEELVALYRDLQGEHPDWDEYRQAMVHDRRLVLRLGPSGPTACGRSVGAMVTDGAVRLRQAVVVTSDLGGVASRIQRELDLPEPFVDLGVGEFGLENRVFEVGSDFLEVLTPTRRGTAGGRYLERRGGDAGYMAIFQLDDLAGARGRVADLGIRIVWQADLPDMSGTHLHPADVPGAIVSLDRPDPPESWHWAGPRWRGGAPPDARRGGISSLTIAAVEPTVLAHRWGEVLDVVPDGDAVIDLAGAGQQLRFVPLGTDRREDEGIVAVGLRLGDRTHAFDAAGVRFDVAPAD